MTIFGLSTAFLVASAHAAYNPWAGYGHGSPTSTHTSNAAESSVTYQGTGPYAAGAYINYTAVPGYFLQDDPSTNASTFDYTAVNFGLINRTYDADGGWPSSSRLTQWQRFERQVARLNRKAPRNVDYKVLFMGRHGQGFHNAAETFYGTPAWNCYWAELDGNSTVSWVDAHLTQPGIVQAQVANVFWASRIAEQKIHTPDSFYTSPLFRCTSTADITFSGLDLGAHGGARRFVPTVKELLREGVSIHTCDHRSNKTYLAATFPGYRFERGFVEDDPLWNGVTAESDSAQVYRSRILLDDVFTNDKGVYISFTSHSGEIRSLLKVLNHREFSLNTGAVIPVLVRAETIVPPPTTTLPWTASPHCTEPPVTSISGGGACICPNSASPVTSPLVTVTQA